MMHAFRKATRAGMALCASGFLLTLTSTAFGASMTEVYGFPAGENPFSGLTVGPNGTLFGTTPGGGTGNNGTIFQITPVGGLVWSISLGSIGSTPYGPLLLGSDGVLYGTASSGGANQRGSIFKVTQDGTVSRIWSFNGTDGAAPYCGLIQLKNGKFYGTTSSGGSSGVGTIFQVTTGGAFSNLFSFSVTNGANPYSGLVVGKDGNLYGVTQFGGTYGNGTIFQLGTSNAFKSMVSFRGDNGENPKGMILGRNGSLYGVTIGGGPNALGTLFKFTTPSSLTTLVAFNGANGSHPNAALFQAPNGDFFGTTQMGGANGVGTVFTYNSSGMQTFDSFSLTENGGFPTSTLIQANDGNLYGTTTSGGSLGNGTIFRIGNIAPVITSTLANRTNRMGTNAVFTATAKGSMPLRYQWQRAGLNLTNGGNFFGVTSPTLVISNISGADAGKYTVVVTNSSGVAQASAFLTVSVDAKASILSPATGKRGTNWVITGSASDSIHPFQVYAWVTNLNTGEVSEPVLVANDTNRWTFTPTLLPGTNIVAVQTRNDLHNDSKIATRTFFQVELSLFSLSTNGNGSVIATAAFPGEPRPIDGAMLNIGQGYRITAKPAQNFVFTNWSGTLSNNNPTLSFIMKPGMSLVANFVPNGFINMAGVYSGLIQETDARIESSGRLTSFKVNRDGTYSGKITLQGVIYPFSGSFDLSGNTTQAIKRAQGNLTVRMQLNLGSNPRFLSGTVSASHWTAQLMAWAAAPSEAPTTATMLLEPDPVGAGPSGFGYATATSRSGILTLTGHLADGTALIDSQRITENGQYPLYLSLYTNTGALIGLLDVTNGIPSGSVTWIGSTNSVFTNVLPVIGSPWVSPAKGSAIQLTNLNLHLSGGGLTNPLSYLINFDKNKIVPASGATNNATNSLSGSINPKNGVITLSFGTGAGKSTATAFGAMLLDTTNAGGYFVRGTKFGSFNINP